MPVAAPSLGHARLIRKLESIAELTDKDRQALKELPIHVKDMGPGSEVIRNGEQPTSCCLLIEGFMHRYKQLPNGRRQVLSYHLPGDIPDLLSLRLDRMDHSLGTIVPTKAAFIPHGAIQALIQGSPTLNAAFTRDMLLDAAVFREWIVNLGSRLAGPRIAHLFCEIVTRMKSLGLGFENSFVLPLSQAEIGDATGMSSVHVNRSIQELRAAKLIAFKAHTLRLLDWEGLRKLGGFDPTYLNLKALPDTTGH